MHPTQHLMTSPTGQFSREHISLDPSPLAVESIDKMLLQEPYFQLTSHMAVTDHAMKPCMKQAMAAVGLA